LSVYLWQCDREDVLNDEAALAYLIWVRESGLLMMDAPAQRTDIEEMILNGQA